MYEAKLNIADSLLQASYLIKTPGTGPGKGLILQMVVDGMTPIDYIGSRYLWVKEDLAKTCRCRAVHL